jgi:tetratricopeptide (TPR) repeat protein
MNRIATITTLCLAIFLVPVSADETVVGQMNIQDAKELFEEGWWDDAARVFEDLLKKNPNAPEVYSQLALVYVAKTNLGRWVDRGKMEAYAKKAVEMDGSNSEYRMIFGHAVGLRALRGSKLKLRGRAKASKKAYVKALELDPNNAEARNSLIEYLMQAPGFAGGSKEDALKQADVIGEMNPAKGHAVRADLYNRMDEHEKALAEARRAIELEPDSLKWRYAYAGICRAQDKFEQAESVYREILTMDPDALDVYINTGRMYREQEEWEQAQAQYEKILEIDPQHADAYEGLGFMYQEMERWDDAVAAFDRVLVIDPTRVNALYQVGRTNVLAEGNLDRAEECFVAYIDSRRKGWWPDRSSAHWRLAMVHDLRGDTDLALAELKTSRELNPDNDEAEKMLKRLKREKKMGKR